MNHSYTRLFELTHEGQAVVMVTVAHIAGSAPREAGAKMLVTRDALFGTIGGGNLEFEAITIARQKLSDGPGAVPKRFVELFPLGPMLEQCCGGAVFLHFEIIRDDKDDWLRTAAKCEQGGGALMLVSRTKQNDTRFKTDKLVISAGHCVGSLGDKDTDELALQKAKAMLSAPEKTNSVLLHPLTDSGSALPDLSDALFFETLVPAGFQVVLFGAGHVGKAVISTMSSALRCRITWIDSRSDIFPAAIPGNVEIRVAEDPLTEIENLPADMYCLVMTHSHQLDQAICEAILRRDQFNYLGLIGSQTKYRRFIQRLTANGIPEEQLERLCCPVGIPGIQAKEPAAIAVSITAQFLQFHQQGHTVKQPLPVA